MRKELTMKTVSEIFKLAARINIKPKDIIGIGGDIVKMGTNLFNTKVNPKLTEFINKKGEIPTKIVEQIKVHLRSLKNVSENQLELFKLNLKDIVNAKFPPKAEVIKLPVAGSKELATEVQKSVKTIKLTDKETKYIRELIDDTGGNKFTAEILEEVPSLRLKGNSLSMADKEIMNFHRFMEDINVFAETNKKLIPPRIRDTWKKNSLLNQLIKKQADILDIKTGQKIPAAGITQLETGIKQLGSKEYYLNELKNTYPKHYQRLKGNESTAELKEMIYRLDTEGIPFATGGIAPLFSKRPGYNKGELVDEVNVLMEKTPFFTQEDYDKVKFEDPEGKYAIENWGKGEAPVAEVTEDDEIVSYMGEFVEGETEKNLDKAKVLAHEKLHLLWEDPEVRATAPPWMQEQFRKGDKLWKKYEEAFDAGDDKKADAYYDAWEKLTSGIALDPDKPATGGGDVMGEELYTRFIEDKYFPKTESDEGPWGSRVYFDKILKEHWDPYAEKFNKLMKSREAQGGIVNLLYGGFI